MMMSIRYAWILLLSFVFTNAVPLNSNCGDSIACDGTGVVCRDAKCQCNTPFYTPCKAACEVNAKFAYQGENCAVPENCIGNANCQGGTCQCISGYTPKNGACFRTMYSSCVNGTECWSGYCAQSQCQCAPDYESVDNATTCRLKLFNVYNNWDEANAANAFCTNDSSCLDTIAECKADSVHLQSKFCQCPTDYELKVDDNRRRCEPILGQHLSPLDYEPSDYGKCGKCEDQNAVCTDVGTKKTCWCRAGYTKNGKNCQSRGKPGMIFPNSKDVQMHDFTSACSSNPDGTVVSANKVCACAPGYEFVDRNLPCRKIQPKWMDKYNEYGVCTQINSRDQSIIEPDVCPEPLKCEARNDKYVCSCGKDKVLDLDNPNQCVYLIGKGANATDGICPSNAQIGTTGNCECDVGYKATSDNQRCELKLSSNVADLSCNTNLTDHTMCQTLFGTKAILCTIGECRCSSDSFSNEMNTLCYVKLDQSSTLPSDICPLNSDVITGRCRCNAGYRPSSDLRECVRLDIILTEYQSPSTNINGDVTIEDCRALYGGLVELYPSVRCQCPSNTFINENKTRCWYPLGINLPTPPDAQFCPPDSEGSKLICICDAGLKADGNKCVPFTDRVYSDNDPTATNVAGITDTDCAALFGSASIKATGGDYCICRTLVAFRAKNDGYCLYYIDIESSAFKTNKTCPDHALHTDGPSNSKCYCEPGYHVPSGSNTLCELANITLIGADKMDATNNCTTFTTDDCTVKYGKQAFCKGEQCYCNRESSYKTNDACEPFSNYAFPGEHELHLYACDDDCSGDGVICDYLTGNPNYKVCQCEDGSFLDPKTQTCASNRCTNCDEGKGFECRDYICQCKNGFIPAGSTCVEYTNKLQLYQPCNQTIYRETNIDQSLVCDSRCDHARCNTGYRLDVAQCVRHRLENDKCIHQETICSGIDRNADCDRNENQCLCKPFYYKFDEKCARAVGVECRENSECGFGICKGGHCDCDEGQRLQETLDGSGRPIKYCVNGIDRIRSNPVFLLILFILVRVFF